MANKAAMASPESDEEYLDDPIQLIDLDQERFTAAGQNYNAVNTTYPIFDLTDSDGDVCIEKNNNLSYKSLPRFKKVPITLPVTFFEISRNVEQFNKCKPLSIQVVNCEQYPWYHKKYLYKSVGQDEDTMTVEGFKVKIRPVSSPYRNLKISESKPLECEDSKQKTLSLKNQADDSQVDFKKNLGLIGMKITQTHDKPCNSKQMKTKYVISKDKNIAVPKINTSPPKKTNKKCEKKKEKKNKNTCKGYTNPDETINKMSKNEKLIKKTFPKVDTTPNEYKHKNFENKNISTTSLLGTTLEKSTDKIFAECAYKKDTNATVIGTNKSEIQCVQNFANLTDKWEVNISKVEGDRVITHRTDLEKQTNIVPTSKVQEVVDNKCDDLKQEPLRVNSKHLPLTNKQPNLKLVISRDDNDTFQSAFVNENCDVQKSKLTTNKSKHKPSNTSVNFIGCKIKKQNDWSVKRAIDVEMKKSAGLLKSPLEVTNTILNNDDKKKQLKEIYKEIGNNSVKLADKKEINSEYNCKPTNKNILKMKFVKTKNTVNNAGEPNKTAASGNQKGNFLIYNAATANLIKEQSNNEKHILPKDINLIVDQKEKNKSLKKIDKILYQAVQTPALAKDESPKITNHQKSSPDGKKTVKNIANIRNTTENTINALLSSNINNKIQPNAMGFEKYTKITDPTSHQISCDVSNSEHPIQKPHSLLKDPRCSKYYTNKKNTLVWMPVPQPTNKNLGSNLPSIKDSIQDKPNNQDTIDLTNINSPIQHHLPNNIHLNSSTTSNVPLVGASNKSWATIDFQTNMETQLHQKQPQTQEFTCNNTMTHLCDPQIPLNIPPEAKRYPRLVKISKRHIGVTENIINNCNYFNGTPGSLQYAHSNSNEVLQNQPYNNVNMNQIPGQLYPLNHENMTQNVPTQQSSSLRVQQNPEAINPQMLAHYHAAAQQLVRRPSLNQPLVNVQNLAMPDEQVSHQFLSTNVQLNENTLKKMSSQAEHLLQTANQFNKTAPEILPPTCDIAVIKRLPPRHDFNAGNTEGPPRHPTNKGPSHIILRKPLPKQHNPNTRLLNRSLAPRHDVPKHAYPSNFGYNGQQNMNYGQRFQQAYSDLNKIPPQNYVHCAPIYSGFPRNMGSVNPAPYNHCWNNYYPIMLSAPPPPPPLPNSDIIQPQQQLTPTSSQTSVSNSKSDVITSTAKSVSGTTVIGCNNSGPVRKINILSEPVQVSSLNTLTQPPLHVTVQLANENNETAKNNSNSSNLQQLIKDTNNDIEKKTLTNGRKVKQVQEILREVETLNSKREMLEELSKLTTIESSSHNSVNELKIPLLTASIPQEVISNKRPLPKPEIIKGKSNVIENFETASDAKHGASNLNKSVIPKNDVKQQDAKFFKKPLPKCDAKQDYGSLISITQSKSEVKQQEANPSKNPLPESKPTQVRGNSLKRPVTKSDANNEKTYSLKTLPGKNEQSSIQRSKPGPLSKKLKFNPPPPPSSSAIIPPVHKGYSPPILPIPTYQKSLEILARSNIGDSNSSLPTIHETEYESAEIREGSRYMSDIQEKTAKKISLDEYKKRYQGDLKADDLEVNNIFIEIKSETSEQDLGYVSDGTTKL